MKVPVATGIQDHIHLDIDNGEHIDRDNAPLSRWYATKRAEIPQVQLTVSRSITGRTHVGRVVDLSSGLPMQHTDWRFVLRVSRSEWQELKTLHGKHCLFVDNDHVADGVNHTDYVQAVNLRAISSIDNLEPMLTKFDVTVELVDLEGHTYDTV